MALGEGFTNPQRVIDKSFDAFIRGGNDIANKIAMTSSQISSQVAQEKKFQATQKAALESEEQSMYSKVNEIGNTGNAALDENMMAFWNEKTDEYFKIKNAMDQGTVSRQEGNKALARINGLVGQFKEEAAYLATQSATYQEDLKNGKVSSVGSIQNKAMLNGLGSGGNVGIIERGGKLYYYQPEHTDADGNKVEASMINGREMMAKSQTGGNLYETIPDISSNLKTAFNETYQPNNIDSKYVRTITAINGQPIPGQPGEVFKNIPPGQKYTYQIIDDKGKVDGQEALMSNGILDPILNNSNIMPSYWQDSVPDKWLEENGYGQDIIDSRWGEFAPDMTDEEKQDMTAKQNEAAKKYMAEQAYNNNADMDNKLKFMSKEKIVKPGSNSNSNSNNPAPTVKFTNSTGTPYNPTQQSDFLKKRKQLEYIDTELKNIADEQITEDYILNLATGSYPGLTKENGEIVTGYGDIIGNVDALRKAMKSLKGIDAGYEVMAEDYEAYENNKAGGASQFNNP